MSIAEHALTAEQSAVPCVPCQNKLDKLDWSTERSYELGGSAVGVRSTDPTFLSWLDRALADRRSEDAILPTYSVVVGGEGERSMKRDIHILYRGTEAILRTESLRTLGLGLLSEMTAHLLHERRDRIYLGMAPVSRGDALALVTPSFVPTLAKMGRRAARAGFALPGHAWVAVEPGTSLVVPAPNLLGVGEGVPDELARNGADDEHIVVHAARAVNAIIVGAAGSMDPRPISAAEALYRVAGATINLRALGGDALEGLLSLVRSAGVYAMHPGSKEILSALGQMLPVPVAAR